MKLRYRDRHRDIQYQSAASWVPKGYIGHPPRTGPRKVIRKWLAAAISGARKINAKNYITKCSTICYMEQILTKSGWHFITVEYCKKPNEIYPDDKNYIQAINGYMINKKKRRIPVRVLFHYYT